MEHLLPVATLDQLKLVLAKDGIDVAVSDSFSGLAVIKKLGLEDRINVLMPPLQKNDIYHFLHEKHRDLVPKVEKVLWKMQASGELELLRRQIVERYLAQ
jgi:polar amino acid transport system substrate-binding protein